MDKSRTYNHLNKRTSISDVKITRFFHNILAMIIVAWFSKGVFSYLTPFISGELMIGVFLMWFILAIFMDYNYLKNVILHTTTLIIFYLYVLFSSLYNFDDTVNTYIYQLGYLIIIFLISLFYYNKDNYPKFKKTIIKFLLLDTIFIGIKTYIQLQKYPNISRDLAMANSGELLSNINTFAVGGYDYIYSLTPILLFLTYFLFNFQIKKVKKVGLVLILIFIILLIPKSAYATATLLSAFFLGFLVITNYTGKLFWPFIFILFSLVITWLFYSGGLSNVFLFFSQNIQISDTISARLGDLAILFSRNNQIVGSVGARLNVYDSTLDTILNNNLFVGISLSSNSIYKVGGHASWLDLFGQYGLISFFLFFFMLRTKKILIKNLDDKFKSFVNLYWMYFFVLGFINTLLFGRIFLVWLLLIPWLLQYLQEMDEYKYS